MIRLAIAGFPRLVCDTREIEREGDSYTVLTLESLREEHPRCRPVLILGRDAFDRLPRWHRWREIRELADIVVVNRPGSTDGGSSPEWLAPHRPVAELNPSAPVGQVVFIRIPPCDVSATELRGHLARGEDVSGMLPEAVFSYIKANDLYA